MWDPNTDDGSLRRCVHEDSNRASHFGAGGDSPIGDQVLEGVDAMEAGIGCVEKCAILIERGGSVGGLGVRKQTKGIAVGVAIIGEGVDRDGLAGEGCGVVENCGGRVVGDDAIDQQGDVVDVSDLESRYNNAVDVSYFLTRVGGAIGGDGDAVPFGGRAEEVMGSDAVVAKEADGSHSAVADGDGSDFLAGQEAAECAARRQLDFIDAGPEDSKSQTN